MKRKLNQFFQTHSGENSLEIALDMIAHKAEYAKDALESEDEDEFVYYLLEAHNMIENLITELGINPEQVKQKYPHGLESKYKKRNKSYERYPNPYEKHNVDYYDIRPNEAPKPNYPEPTRQPYPEQPGRPAGFRYY